MPLQENFEKYVSCCLYVLHYFNIICEIKVQCKEVKTQQVDLW